MTKSALREAIAAGDPDASGPLLDAGADVRYTQPYGYSALIDALYGRRIEDDRQLVPLLRLLIERGADLDVANEHGEPLSIASRADRFDAVRVLLAAGADPAPLGWTPLRRAVALGSPEDVRARVEAGDDRTARDPWDRTAWLLGAQAGDVAWMEVLLAAGAGRKDRGRGGTTLLAYPVGNGHAAMVRWLLAHGADPNGMNDYGGTALADFTTSVSGRRHLRARKAAVPNTRWYCDTAINRYPFPPPSCGAERVGGLSGDGF